MVILGIDPGIARVGWGVIDKVNSSNIKTIAYDCFETHKSTPEQERLVAIYEHIAGLIKKYKPEAVAIETLFFAANTKTAFTVGQARGVIVLACGQAKTTTAGYTPLQIKQAITGYGQADKQQMQRMVQSILKLKKVPQPDDTADALAIAITHAYTQKFN